MSSSPPNRWYMTLNYEDDRPRGVIQTNGDTRFIGDEVKRAGRAFTLPEHVLRLAHAEYTRQHPGQDYERIQERAGFGLFEVIGLLADHLDRLDAVPSPARGDRP